MGDKPLDSQHMDIKNELRRLQHHAAIARGDQAYRELSRYVVRKCEEILKAMEERE